MRAEAAHVLLGGQRARVAVDQQQRPLRRRARAAPRARRAGRGPAGCPGRRRADVRRAPAVPRSAASPHGGRPAPRRDVHADGRTAAAALDAIAAGGRGRRCSRPLQCTAAIAAAPTSTPPPSGQRPPARAAGLRRLARPSCGPNTSCAALSTIARSTSRLARGVGAQQRAVAQQVDAARHAARELVDALQRAARRTAAPPSGRPPPSGARCIAPVSFSDSASR